MRLTDAPGIVALGAAAVALVALIVTLALAAQLRRLRAAQKVVLGERGAADLVLHAGELQAAFDVLAARVEQVSGELDERMRLAEQRLDATFAYRALVRYDAYGELSGHQSSTLALLDAGHNGVVISTIAHRDSARMYCTQIHAGQGEHQLSPEEAKAIRLALAGTPGTVTLD